MRDQQPVPKPVLRPRAVSQAAIKGALTAALPQLEVDDGVAVELLDSEYRVIPLKQMMDVVQTCHVEAIRYQANYVDCDKHSRLLWSLIPVIFRINNIGMVLDYSGRHSYNVVVVDADDDKPEGDGDGLKVVWLEPQTGSAIKIHSEPYYSLKRGLILF